ncbi:hypothetical protein QIY50_00530 [Pseudomonas putida]|nr:hypothetical protein QIY50_00530 [Pseudomonas putida]
MLAGVDSLGTPAFLDDSVPRPPRLDAAAHLSAQARPALAPRRVALGKRGSA